jgi:2-polyprenyl-6-methoxyphenol hydroxylase-like FAD-dependent oxidoreductase
VLSTPEPREACVDDWLVNEAAIRTGRGLDLKTRVWESAFGVERRLARSWHKGRLFLAGDAAHLMSPIVGQNMNTGFADAEYLAAALAELFAEEGRPSLGRLASLGERYTKTRSKSARAAADRAWAMMRLGTARGRFTTVFRSAFVGAALSLPSASILAGIFTMHTIPGATLARLHGGLR